MIIASRSLRAALEREYDGLSVLHLCMLESNYPLLIALLDAGLDPNSVSKAGDSLMSLAVTCKDYVAIDLLLKYRASIRGAPLDDAEPVHHAIISDDVQLVTFLCERGSRPWESPREYEVVRPKYPPMQSVRSETMRQLLLSLAAKQDSSFRGLD